MPGLIQNREAFLRVYKGLYMQRRDAYKYVQGYYTEG